VNQSIKCMYCDNQRLRGMKTCKDEHSVEVDLGCELLGCNNSADASAFCDFHTTQMNEQELYWTVYARRMETQEQYDACKEVKEWVVTYDFDKRIINNEWGSSGLEDILRDICKEARRHNEYYVEQIEQLKKRVKELEERSGEYTELFKCPQCGWEYASKTVPHNCY